MHDGLEVVPYHKEMVDGMSIAPMLALARASAGHVSKRINVF